MNKHSLLKVDTLQKELTELLYKDPDAFLIEHKNNTLNISRYTSFLNSAKYTPEQKESYRIALQKFQERHELFLTILKDSIYAKSPDILKRG